MAELVGQNLPSGSGLCGNKRHHSSDESDGACTPAKIVRNDIRRLLEMPERLTDPGSESEFSFQEDETDGACTPAKIIRNDIRRLLEMPERLTDPGSETEFSFQEDETDLCCRSSETSGSESWGRNAVGRVEYEIRSPNEAPNPFGDSSTASEASVNELQVIGLPPPKPTFDEENSSCASSGSSDVFDPEIPRRDYWTCMQCNNVNNRPAFRYCEKCYKVRRDMYQPRSKPRKRRKRKSSKGVATRKSSERVAGTAGTNRFRPNSTTFSDFSGIKLESTARDNRDSGIACSQSSGLGCSQSSGLGCSQSTIGSGVPAGGKDSDSSTSPDSGCDSVYFHGIRLSSTRDHSLKVSPLARLIHGEVGVIGSQSNILHRSSSQTVDAVRPFSSQTVGAVQPSAGQSVDSVSQDIDEVDTVHQEIDEVDHVGHSVHQNIDKVDAMGPRVHRAIGEVDAVGPSVRRDIDEVDAVEPRLHRGIDEVDAVGPRVNRAIDEVDAVGPRVNRAIDEVDAVGPRVNRAIDEVDAVGPRVNRAIDEVDAVGPSVRRDVDEVDAVGPHVHRAVDEVDTVGPSVCRDIDEVDAVGPCVHRGIDEVDAVGPSVHRGIDEVDAVGPSTTPAVDPVQFAQSHRVDKVELPSSPVSLCVNKRSVRTQTDLCFINKSEIPKERPVVDDEKCMTCFSRPLDGVFVHSAYAHVCCCYKCTVKVWKTSKRCPLCNCKVMNVLRIYKL